ncbi:MAG: hypothetical protein WC050_00770 [Candidatus Paceibacterota bacterium]
MIIAVCMFVPIASKAESVVYELEKCELAWILKDQKGNVRAIQIDCPKVRPKARGYVFSYDEAEYGKSNQWASAVKGSRVKCPEARLEVGDRARPYMFEDMERYQVCIPDTDNVAAAAK